MQQMDVSYSIPSSGYLSAQQGKNTHVFHALLSDIQCNKRRLKSGSFDFHNWPVLLQAMSAAAISSLVQVFLTSEFTQIMAL